MDELTDAEIELLFESLPDPEVLPAFRIEGAFALRHDSGVQDTLAELVIRLSDHMPSSQLTDVLVPGHYYFQFAIVKGEEDGA